MTTILTATYDGEVLRLDEPIELEPNTRVRITIETTEPILTKKRSFLKTALSLKLQGPPDWSARFEDYLYERENGFTK
ncbi:MAG: antitoxin family protein [candidate division KSB1 bacterium]|nr:antitoxin family protein [candidate division KSB1 bacterium]MDZ7301621.1 antitoxin family protein [candidate division KSB1 bacterium]MDZ7310963.1 antitoxin family protein [candidate division KSB1 bacterium]